jgi:hypothetical protein
MAVNPEPVSRYCISNEDLSIASLNLQIGQGIADRVQGTDATKFIQEAEDWGEEHVDEFLAVPLSPVIARGQDPSDFTPNDPSTLSKRNYPYQFIEAVIYQALGRLLMSEYFENSPNKSESAQAAFDRSWSLMNQFRDRLPTRVGAGRKRHYNVHMPPTIAPRFQSDFRREQQ